MKLAWLFLICILPACTTAPNRKIAQSQDTKYYHGVVNMSSADEKIPYGKTTSLIKRIIDPSQRSITEIVLQPSRIPQQKPKDINTVLTRVGDSNIFSATDDGHTFEGKITFEGSEWNWDRWSYDIRLADGSKLKGLGSIDSEGIKTQKIFYKPDGTASVLLKENLKSISSEEYDLHYKEIIGNEP